MFEVINLLKAGKKDPQIFVLVLKDLENTTKGYAQTTRHGTESHLREYLKNSGMSDTKIDEAFRRAKET
jgi:hypothetical protein